MLLFVVSWIWIMHWPIVNFIKFFAHIFCTKVHSKLDCKLPKRRVYKKKLYVKHWWKLTPSIIDSCLKTRTVITQIWNFSKGKGEACNYWSSHTLRNFFIGKPNNGQTTEGVDFINVLCTTFTLSEPKSVKWQCWLDCLFLRMRDLRA